MRGWYSVSGEKVVTLIDLGIQTVAARLSVADTSLKNPRWRHSMGIKDMQFLFRVVGKREIRLYYWDPFNLEIFAIHKLA